MHCQQISNPLCNHVATLSKVQRAVPVLKIHYSAGVGRAQFALLQHIYVALKLILHQHSLCAAILQLRTNSHTIVQAVPNNKFWEGGSRSERIVMV